MDNRLLNTFLEFTRIDAPSRKERAVGELLMSKLASLGISSVMDKAGEKIGGDCGNVYAYIEGLNSEEAPVLFSAHLDTVEPSRGKTPVVEADVRGGTIIKAGNGAVLGADDISGVAIILDAMETVISGGKPHRPIELLFTAAEEIYGKGAAAFDYSVIKSKEAYTLDLGGEIGLCAVAAPTILSFTIEVAGKAAHAGFCPFEGVNALTCAARAVAKLPQGVLKEGLTRNFGVIGGGKQSNIVCDYVKINGEIRALDDDEATRLWNETVNGFNEEAEKIGAKITTASRREIIAYKTDENADCVARFKAACGAEGVTFKPAATMGGSDHNEFAQNGITGIVIACSMHDVHTTAEYAVLEEMEKCRDIVVRLME